jgi:plastocyanin
MKKTIIIILIIAAVLVGGYFLIARGYKSPAPNPNPNPNTPSGAVATDKVTIKNFAFDPPIITVKSGTTVTWTNEDAAAHQVASDPHPTHTDLPGLISDPFAQGQTYSFTFTKVGTFGYHCHIHPSMTGKVIVTP